MKRAMMAGLAALVLALPARALEPEVNLSGVFALSFSYYNSDLSGYDYDLENNASHFRVEAGAQEVGLRAFMAYDREANNDGAAEGAREFFAGVETAYGTLLYGKKATDYRIAGERLDPFFNTSAAGFNGQFSATGSSYGLSALTNGFTSNTIAYRSPAWAGVSFNLGGYISDNAEPNDRHDAGAGVTWSDSDWGLETGLQTLHISGVGVVTGAPGEATALRGHASYARHLWAVGLSYEWVDVDTELEARKYAFLSASYQLLEDLRLAVALGSVADSDSAPVNIDGTGLTVGAFFGITRNLSTYVALRSVEYADTDDSTVSAALGTRFVFDVDL